jgi:hypothetical protein
MLCDYHRIVQLQYEITPTDHLEMVKVVRFRRKTQVIRICLDVVGLLLGFEVYCYFNLVWGVFLITFFGVLAVLQMFMPFLVHRRVYNRNPRLFGMKTVIFDDDGIKSDGAMGHVERRWNAFEKFSETNNLFITYLTRDVVGIVPKRAFASPEAVAQFRDLLASRIRPAK